MLLEQVYASGTGNRRPPLFFLEWLPKFKKQRQPRTSDGLKLPTVGYAAPASPSKRTPGMLQALGMRAKEAHADTVPAKSASNTGVLSF